MKRFPLLALLAIGLVAAGCRGTGGGTGGGDGGGMPSPVAMGTGEAGSEATAPGGTVVRTPISLSALLDQTGSLAHFGESAAVALELAVEDVNRELGDQVELQPISIVDSQVNPARALEALKFLHENGQWIVIGPQSSAELAEVKPYADANGIILVSPSSVARSLSIAGDNVFRLAPDDTLQAEAMSAMLREAGLESVVMVVRDDVWGDDLSSQVKGMLAEDPPVAVDEITYAPSTTDFAELVSGIDEHVRQAVAEHGADKVGVYLLAFAEAVPILAEASHHPDLAAVRWFGASAMAQSPALTSDPLAAAFAESVGYPCPVFGLDPTTEDRWAPLRERIEARTGQDADIYALAAYDAVWLIAKTLLAAGKPDDFTAFKAQLPQTAATYVGVTGPMELNEAGDRKRGNDDFWAVRVSAGGPEWLRVATYDSLTHALTTDVRQP